MIRSITTALLVCLCLMVGATGAVNLQEQAVTWADFSFINHITASISRVYFATTNGIIVYNSDRAAWDDPITLPPDLSRNIRRVWVNTFDDQLYVQTDVSLFEYDINLETWFPITELPRIDSDVRHLPIPETMLPPFGYNVTADGVLVDKHGRSFAISDIIDPNTGRLWLGLWGYGPAVANRTSEVIELMPYGLLQTRVNAIYLDADTLFVSGAVFNDVRTGISAFNLADNTFSYIETGLNTRFPATDINCIAGDDYYLYAGTPFGLYRIERDTRRIRDKFDVRYGLNDDNVLSIASFGDSLFVGTYKGMTLYTFDADSAKYVAPGEFNNQTVYDFERINNHLWVASSNGLYRIDRRYGDLQRFRDPTGTTFGNVYALDSFGDQLWAATDDGAIRIDLASGEVESFSSILYNRGYRALAVNDRIAAISSDRGMTFIFHDLDKPYQKEFTRDDGLPSPYVYSLRMDGDYLWVGTDEGLTRFLWNNPDRVD